MVLDVMYTSATHVGLLHDITYLAKMDVFMAELSRLSNICLIINQVDETGVSQPE